MTLILLFNPSTNRRLLFISTAAKERFGIQVSEKISAVFIDHFQDMTQAHFTVRKLERKYGKEHVALWYTDIMNNNKNVVTAHLKISSL